MKVNQLDLFSGIGGFHLGLERAGFEVTSYFSEVDKHAVAVYKHQFKNATYVGSVTDVRGDELPTIDIITFGSPCQDFSLAGKRSGMGGERSSLILEAIRLIKECRPRVFIWENVKGTFSSNSGEDFASILQEFANIGGYRLEWQLLNTARHTRLPQNRERIYLVGYSATPGPDWGGIFPIRETSPRHDELEGTRRPVSKTLTARGQASLHSGMQLVGVKQIGTRTDSNSGRQPYQQHRIYDASGISPALSHFKSDLIIRVYDDYNGKFREDGNAGTLSTNCGSPSPRNGQKIIHSHEGMLNLKDAAMIRRLTPIECERLQGFPDNHTAFGDYDGVVKPMKNVHRYKQCGNAVTVDVVWAVAERLKVLL